MPVRPLRAWLPPPGHLAVLLVVSALTAWAGIALTRQVGNLATLWFTNGILLAVLLTRPTRQWPALLAVGLTGAGLADHLAGQPLAAILVLQASNAIDILLPAVLLRDRRGNSPDLTLPGAFVEFIVFGVLLTPMISGLLAARLLAPIWHVPMLPLLTRWYLGDALGIAVMTPPCTTPVSGSPTSFSE